MNKNIQYKKIKQAKEILGLGEKSTLKNIKERFYELCHKWHPDKGSAPKKKSNEMIQKITEAYKVIMDYCNNYEYSFKDEEIKRYISYEELWDKQFGSDPLWGGDDDR